MHRGRGALGAIIILLTGCTAEVLQEAGAAREACIERAAASGADRATISATYLGQDGPGRHTYNVTAGVDSYRCVVDDDHRIIGFGRMEHM
jgi:hypothetical protein